MPETLSGWRMLPNQVNEEIMKELTTCGICCRTDCKAHKTECEGCLELDGKIPWAVYYGKEYCPIVECARSKGLSSCGECGLAPCQVWLDTRDPDFTDEQFAADIANRLKNLTEMKSDS